MPGGGARVQNLGHLLVKVSLVGYISLAIIRSHSYLDYRYPIGYRVGSMSRGGGGLSSISRTSILLLSPAFSKKSRGT